MEKASGKVSADETQSDLPGKDQNQFGRSPGARVETRAEHPVAGCVMLCWGFLLRRSIPELNHVRFLRTSFVLRFSFSQFKISYLYPFWRTPFSQ